MIKKVGYCYYAHISNIRELINSLNYEHGSRLMQVLTDNDREIKNALVGVIYVNNYQIVKYNLKDYSVSLIQSEDWDAANEPTVGDSYCFKIDGNVRIIKGGSKVYHNKWQFVSKDYKGFDIERAKRRTEEWNSIQGIEKIKNRIGSKRFWINLLKENNMEV